MLPIAFMACAMASIAFVIYGLRRGLLSPLTIIGVHLLVGVAIRYIVITLPDAPRIGYFYNVLLSKSDIEPTYIFLDLFFFQIALMVGYLLFQGGTRKYAMKTAATFSMRSAEISPVFAVGVFLSGWLFFFWVCLSQYGSIESALFIFQKRALLFGSDVTIARAMLVVSMAGLTMLTVWAAGPKARYNPARYAVLCLAILHVCMMFQLGGRGATVTHALVLGFTYWSMRGLVRPKLTFRSIAIAALAVPSLAAIIIVGMGVRLAAQTRMEIPQAIAAVTSQAQYQISATFPVYDLYSAAKAFSKQEGLTYGSNYVALGSRAVPRSIWSDKPLILGIQLREFFYGDRLSAVPPTVFGEFYIAFGLTGAILGSLLFGGLLSGVGWLQMAIRAHPEYGGLYLFAMLQLSVGVVKSGFENSLFGILYFLLGVSLVKIASRLAGGVPHRRPRTLLT